MFIDTLISAVMVGSVMLIGVLASGVYAKWQERKSR